MAFEFRTLLEEIHRRSIWQILIAYGFGSWVVLGASGTVMDVLGLPDWVPQMAGLICLMALPLVLATAVVEKASAPDQHPPTEASDSWMQRWLTWRRVGVLIPVAFALLATGTTGYMGMRVMGIGTPGTLIAKGIVEEQARLLVADLSSPVGDSLTAAALSESIRIGLARSDVVRVVPLSEIRTTLRLMNAPPGAGFPDSLAIEVAVREGIPLVLVGELAPIGKAYLITVRLFDPEEGREFLSLQEEARSEDELIGAAGRLQGRLRERLGESLRSVQNREPLEFLTSSSIEALRLYTQAMSILENQDEFGRVAALLEQAVHLDPDFAEGWRKLSVVLGNSGTDGRNRLAQIDAMARAYDLRDRLSESERLAVISTYFTSVEVDLQEALKTLELAVARFPEDGRFWTNLGIVRTGLGDYRGARDAQREALNLQVNPVRTLNLIMTACRIEDLETARWALDLREKHGFDPSQNLYLAGMIAYTAGDIQEARRLTREGIEAATSRSASAAHFSRIGMLDALEGRLGEAEQASSRAIGLWLEDGATREVLRTRLRLAELYAVALERTEAARLQVEDGLRLADFSEVHPIDQPHLMKARSLALAGRADLARQALSEWEEATPKGLREAGAGGRRSNVRGLIAMEEGRAEDAFRLLRDAARERGGYPAFEGDLARAFDRAGIADSALVAHRRYLDAPNRDRWIYDPLYLARTYERLGQLHEERGEAEEAIRYLTLFVDLWAEADPDLQPRVEAARMALARLKGGAPGDSGSR